MRDTKRSSNRSSLIQLGLLALTLPSFVWPCGVFELPFEEAVRRNLVQAGYINSYDVITAGALQLEPRRCEAVTPRPMKNACPCIGQRGQTDVLAWPGV